MTTEEKLYIILGPDWWEKMKRGIMESDHDAGAREGTEQGDPSEQG